MHCQRLSSGSIACAEFRVMQAFALELALHLQHLLALHIDGWLRIGQYTLLVLRVRVLCLVVNRVCASHLLARRVEHCSRDAVVL